MFRICLLNYVHGFRIGDKIDTIAQAGDKTDIATAICECRHWILFSAAFFSRVTYATKSALSSVKTCLTFWIFPSSGICRLLAIFSAMFSRLGTTYSRRSEQFHLNRFIITSSFGDSFMENDIMIERRKSENATCTF